MAAETFDLSSIGVANYSKGNILFRQGDIGNAAFIVNSGAVGIYREVDQQKVPLAILRKGELFGEMAAIDGSPRMATAITIKDSTLTIISNELLTDKMSKSDPFVRALFHILLQNLRSVHETYLAKPRTMNDSIAAIQKHSQALAQFMNSKKNPEIGADLSEKIRTLDSLILDLRHIAMKHQAFDNRNSSIPSIGDLMNS